MIIFLEDTNGSVPSIKVFQEARSEERQSSSSSNIGWEQKRWNEMREQETSEEMKKRQNQQLNQFYSTLSKQKEFELQKDQESRKHHDTLLPNQKSPLPLNRYEDEAQNGSQAVFLNAGKRLKTALWWQRVFTTSSLRIAENLLSK